MNIKVEKALLERIMSGRIKLEDVKDDTGWVSLDSFDLFITPHGVRMRLRAGGEYVATLDHPADLTRNGVLHVAAGVGFEMRLQLTVKD